MTTRQLRAPLLSVALLSALVLLPHAAQAIKLVVHPAATECFTHHVDDSHFLVPGGPRLEGAVFLDRRSGSQHPAVANAALYAPMGDLIWSQARIESEAHFNVAARGGQSGAYKLCFTNHSPGDILVDLIYFTLSHLRQPSVNLNVPKGSETSRNKQMARKDHLDDLKQEVLVVGELVDILSGEQRYLRRKLDRHILTCQSNNRRALGYTALEVAVLGVVGAWNVYFVSKLFKGAGAYGRIVV